MKIKWKQNLLVAWIGCFFTGASISLVMPFIPVYVEQLGTPKSQVELFSGLAISVTAFAAAIVAPIWGNLADRKGRKIMMIRAAAGMTITMGALAFVPNVYWLLIMRFMNGDDCVAGAKREKWLGSRNIINRCNCWDVNCAIDWRCVGTVVWNGKCLYYYRRYFIHYNVVDYLFS